MECNKDEAIRSKSIAESKLEQKDILGAKKFALKAQALYPGLDGVSQMLTTLDVYLSAENKISGETDWYQVLGVDPSADEDTIKKQYRKLALMLHPDKNNSAGADGAFKLISEASRVMLDKNQRASFDERREYKGFEQKATTQTGGQSAPCRPHPNGVPGSQSVPSNPNQQKVPSAPSQKSRKKVPSATPGPRKNKFPVHTGGPSAPPQPSQHKAQGQTTGQPDFATHPSRPSSPSMEKDFFNFARKTSIPKSQNRKAKVPRTPNPAPPHHIPDSFWTVCYGCNTQYEHHKIFRCQTLLCRHCMKPFIAIEIAAPVNFSRTAKPVSWLPPKHSFENLPGQNAYDLKSNTVAAQKRVPGQTSSNSFMSIFCQQYPFHGTSNTNRRYPSSAEKPGNIVQQEHDGLKRSHTESHVSAGLEGCFKKGKLYDDINRHGINQSMAQGSNDFATEGAYGRWVYGFPGTCSQPSSTRVLSPLEMQKLLMLKAQKEISKKLSESRL